MIVAVPAATPVTVPVVLTVAVAVFEELQGLVVAGVPLPVNCVVNPAHAVKTPVIDGKVFMVTVAVALPPILFV